MKKTIILISLLSALSATVFAQAVISEFGWGMGSLNDRNNGKRDLTSVSTHLIVVSQFGLSISLGLQESFSIDDQNGFSAFHSIMGVGYTYVQDVYTLGAECVVAPDSFLTGGNVFVGVRLSANLFFIGGMGLGADFIYAGMPVEDSGSILNFGIHLAARF